MSTLVIIGNGITGSTVARRVREIDPDRNIILISEESPYFFSRPALMYMYMGHMTEKHTRPYEDHKWDDWRIQRVFDKVNTIDFDKKSCNMANGETIQYDELVLAVGSKSNKFGWPGQDLKAVSGLYHLQDIEQMEKYSPTTKRAVIVGGGLIGIEMAEMFLSRGIKVTFLVREKAFWSMILPPEESSMIMGHMREHHVDLRMETELKEILSDEHGRARAIITNTGEEIECGYVGLTAGVAPNVDLLKDTALDMGRGIKVDHKLRTNLDGVYAAGDCAEFTMPYEGRRPIEQVWYTGKMQALALAETICGTETEYTPGTWFNSAKFFDIEYQTYGMVMGKTPDEEDTLVWKDPKDHRTFRINYVRETGVIKGFNLFGIRGRHSICEKWLTEERTLDYVVSHLGALNFDPEFFTRFEEQFVETYNQKFPSRQVTLKTSKGLFSSITKFLKAS